MPAKMYETEETRKFQKKDSFSIDLPTPHEFQKKVLLSKARFRVCCWARRGGKTELAKIAVTLRAFKRSSNIWYCSPTYQNSERVFREFVHFFREFPEEVVAVNKTNMRIEIMAGEIHTTIEFKSLKDAHNLRGAGLDFVVIDEAAYVTGGIWDEVIEPMLLNTNGEAIFISTPKGKNWFWRFFQYGLDEENEEYESFTMTIYDNPFVTANAIESIKKRLPSPIWAQEYMAEFLKDGGSVFRNVSSCTRDWFQKEVSARMEYIASDGKRNDFVLLQNEKEYVEDMLKRNKSGELSVVFGVDTATVNDYTVITVFDISTQSLIEFSRFSNTTWKEIETEIKRLSERWDPIAILIESNNATGLIEKLEEDGYPVKGIRTTSKSKPEMIQSLSVAIEHGQVSIPNDKILINELNAYEMTTSPQGNLKYSAPAGMHDDCVMSFAVSWLSTINILTAQEMELIFI